MNAPRSVYVHIPFCRHHCGYCNFTVIAGRDDLADRYLLGLQRELDQQTRHAGASPLEVETLYIGGGTPTRLTPDQWELLGQRLEARFQRTSDGEFTIEANPADIDAQRVQALVAIGVNRVSLGVQSFRDAKLRALDRDHTVADVYRAYELLRSAVPQVALDLIFAAPDEGLNEWLADVDQAIALQPDHVSTYGLTYERGTTFWSRLQRSELHERGDELQRAMYIAAIERLGAAGLQQYEVSNFARFGCRSRHNETYWLGGRYWGLGAGASRFVGNERATNHRSTTTYLKRIFGGGDPTAERECVTAETQARERLVFGLRRREGIDMCQIAQDTGVELDALVGDILAKYVALGLMVRDGSRYWLSQEGLLVSDSLWPELV